MGFWCKRICSWGPIVALTLISVVIISASYSAAQIYGLPGMKTLKIINFIVMYPEAIWILYVYFSAMKGPGFIPSGWSPNRKQDQNFLQYCDACKGYKAPRSHHCKSCGHCVLKMDHHCVWINVCVGHENHTTFIAFLFFLSIGCFHAVVLNSYFLYKLFDRAFLRYTRVLPISTYTLFLVISGIAFSIGAALGVIILFIVQMKSVLKNKTQIEEWICDKARDRRKRNKELEPFVYPYDLGWKKNFLQVIRCSLKPAGNGFKWPVKKGCNQYSFTVEQIEQKKEKASYAITCDVITTFSGKRCSFANGGRVFWSMPCLESAMAVDAGQSIVVTRWRRYWVYGSYKKGDDHEVKGWVPRACIKAKPDNMQKTEGCNDQAQVKQRNFKKKPES